MHSEWHDAFKANENENEKSPLPVVDGIAKRSDEKSFFPLPRSLISMFNICFAIPPLTNGDENTIHFPFAFAAHCLPIISLPLPLSWFH